MNTRLVMSLFIFGVVVLLTPVFSGCEDEVEYECDCTAECEDGSYVDLDYYWNIKATTSESRRKAVELCQSDGEESCGSYPLACTCECWKVTVD